MSERQLRHLKITGEFITRLFTGGHEVHVEVTDGLPEDAEFRRIEYDADTDAYLLIFHSEAFGHVPEGAPVPAVDPVTFTELDCGND